MGPGITCNFYLGKIKDRRALGIPVFLFCNSAAPAAETSLALQTRELEDDENKPPFVKKVLTLPQTPDVWGPYDLENDHKARRQGSA